jgi:hypothetical protein
MSTSIDGEYFEPEVSEEYVFDPDEYGPCPVAAATDHKPGTLKRKRFSMERADLSDSLYFWGSSFETISKVVHMMWECPRFEQRDTSLMAFGSSQNLMIKMMPLSRIHLLCSEAQFAHRLEQHRTEIGDVLLKFHGLIWVNYAQFVRAVALNANADTVKQIVSLKPSEGNGEEGSSDPPYLIGILVTDYLPNASTLLEYLVQRRHEANQIVYEAEFNYIQAKLMNFLSRMKYAIPGASHNDLKLDNVLIYWTRQPESIRLSSWVEEVFRHRTPDGKIASFSLPAPPDMRVYVIDFGLSFYPGGSSFHLADRNLGCHGIGPSGISKSHWKHYDTHTLLNAIRDSFLSRPDIGGDSGLFRPEINFCKALEKIYGAHALGFGMTFRCAQEAAGRGGPLVIHPDQGPQPLVEGRLSLLPRLLDIRFGEQERRVQASVVLALSRCDTDSLLKLVVPSCPREMILDLMSDSADKILAANEYLSFEADFATTDRIMAENMLQWKNFKVLT